MEVSKKKQQILTKMDPFTPASHSRHVTAPMTTHYSAVRERSARMKDNLPVPEAILQDLSLLINDEWLDVGKYLEIPDEILPKIQTDYGARHKEATYKMLLGWKQKMGKQATYSILIEALKKAGRGDLAELSIELTDRKKRSKRNTVFTKLHSGSRDRKKRPKRNTVFTNLHSGSRDKVGHFIRCLKVKYTSWLWSMKGTPWMKSGKLKVEDLFVDVGLQLLNSSQKISGSSWQTLHSFKALFTHPDLRRSRMINIEGESGCGKTVLLFQMAHSWCKGETFTENVKVFILLPCRLYNDDSIYRIIKTFLLPKNTFLTVADVRNILTFEKSILALDGGSPDVISEILCNYLDPVCQSIVRNDKLQLIRSSSEPLHKSKFEGIVSYTSIKLEKWHKTQRLSYLQRLLPNDDSKHDIILRWTEGNTALNVVCDNPLCYALTAHFLKDDILWGKDVKIETLSQIFRHVVECLTKTIATKSGTVDDLEAISEISYDGLLSLENISWEIDDLKGVKHYQMLVNAGILVENQDDSLLKVAVTFRHKMFQMWFAALHLSNPTKFSKFYEDDGWYTCLHISNLDTSIILRFICGLNSQSSVKVLNHLARGELKDNENNDNFFLCLHEHCGTDTSLQAAVKAICLRKREFKLACSNQLLFRSMVRFFELASQWKIPIESIDLRDHEIIHIKADGLTLSDGIHLRPLTAKIIKINKWCGSHLAKFLSTCGNVIELRIFATENPGHPHEIQKDLDGAAYKVYWEGPEGICYRLEDSEWKFFSLDIRSDDSPVLSEVLRKELNVGDKGGKLVIEEAAVSLEIPPGALKRETKISIAVVSDGKVKLPGDIPLVTPLIKCEPCGQTFQKPVKLVLPHCGVIRDINEHKVISIQGSFSGETFQWQMERALQTTLFETKCELHLFHFSIHGASIENLESKIMRVFLLNKKTDEMLIVKFWICNDDDSVILNIKSDENSDGYHKMGAFQNFTIYKTLGNVEAGIKEREKKEIHFNDIWRGSRGCVHFEIPFETRKLKKTLFAKQKENDEQSCRKDFIIYLEARSDRPLHKRPRINLDSTCNKEPSQPLQKRRKLQRLHGEGTSNEPSIPVTSIAGSSTSSSDTVNMHQSNHRVQKICEDIVTENSLRKLAGLVTAKRKRLGALLGLSEGQLQQMESSNIGQTDEITYQILLCWKQGNGLEATYGHLFKKLTQVGRRDLAEVPGDVSEWVDTQATESGR